MTIRVDGSSLIAGKIVVSQFAGHGVLASQIPSSGTSGAGYLYNDISAQGMQPTDEVRGLILTWPSAGTLNVNEDSSFSFTGAPDGSYSFSYRGFRNGVSYGDFTETLSITPVAQVPQGTVTVGTATGVTQNSASVPYSYSAADQTGFQFRLNGGAAQVASASPIALSGLTASTAYTIEVRAVNATGNGTWSNAVQFTTAAAPQVPQGSVTIGAVSVTHSTATIPYTYSASDQTGFEYRLNGGSPVTASASPINLSGLTASTGYTIEVRAINATGNGAWSAVRNFTTAAAPQVPQGTFTIGTITAGQTTASVPYTYSASDQTSIQYRVNGGTPVTATASPQSLSSLTPATAYTIEFRAVNAVGNGAWSSPSNFTTAATPRVVSDVLKNNLGTVLANKALNYVAVYNATTGALVVRKTGLSTDANGRFTVSDAALQLGTNYKLDWEFASGERRMPTGVAT